jgi:pSer/pThr/pTyr-binding forkhead associated (FHA) protein
MAILTLKLEGGGAKQYAMASMMTIGRQSDNTVVLDSPGVSSHHACVFRDREDFIVEDLQSTNGTFVNNSRVVRKTLQHGDVVGVGGHTLVFDQRGAVDSTPGEPETLAPLKGETVFLDKQEHQRLLGIVLNAEARAKDQPAVAGKLGLLRVVAGPADRPEYVLDGHTSLIGRANWTLIRLKGWFKPRVAVAITRNQHGYVATLLKGKMLVNNEPIQGRHELKAGDVLEVGGLTLAFGFKVEVERVSAA